MYNSQYLMSQLTNEERVLVNSEVEKRRSSAAAAYLLWVFLGLVGGHRFYFGKTGSGVAMALITILTLGFGVIVTGIWALVDVFLISGWLREDVEQIEVEVAQAILAQRQVN